MKKCKISFVDGCIKYTELYPEKAKKVSHYQIIKHSDAIEVHFMDGSMEVWDPNLDFSVKFD